MPRFITSDSILNAFHRLVAESTRVVDELGGSRLQRALRAVWEGLGDGPPEALARARMLVGVALRLLGEELELGPEVDAEVERVCQAQGPHFPTWLSPATADFAGLDYARYKVRGFYTSTPALGRYFRAVTWLQSVPLRVELQVDLQAAWQLARAQDHETLDALRSNWQALADPADWDLSLFTGRESWDEFCDRVAALPPPPALNDQLALMRAPNIRFLSARALPDSLFFLQHDPTSLPDPRALCAALGSRLAGRTFSGEVGRVETDSRHLFSAYLGVLRRLLQPPPGSAPAFMRGEAWERKSCQTALCGWALMRHTWALHAKDSYLTLGLHDYPRPKGFVEPVPEFYRALADLSERFRTTLDGLGALDPDPGESLAALQDLMHVWRTELEWVTDPDRRGFLSDHLQQCQKLVRGMAMGKLEDPALLRSYLKRSDLNSPSIPKAGSACTSGLDGREPCTSTIQRHRAPFCAAAPS